MIKQDEHTRYPFYCTECEFQTADKQEAKQHTCEVCDECGRVHIFED